MVAESPIIISDEYRTRVLNGEPILDTVQNIVVISMQKFEDYQKAKANDEYLNKIRKADEEIDAGKMIIKSIDELTAMED